MGGPCTVNGVSYDALDNFLQCSFELDGVQWTSAEQYFQAAKFLDPDYNEEIRGCHDGDACWSLGNTRAYPIRDDWEAVKVDVMYEANRAKFSAPGNEALREALLSTGTGQIQAYGFPFWAKWNGILLERIREELRPAAGSEGQSAGGVARDEVVLRQRTEAMETYRREQRESAEGMSCCVE
jgi:hypothetical protein